MGSLGYGQPTFAEHFVDGRRWDCFAGVIGFKLHSLRSWELVLTHFTEKATEAEGA